MSKETTDGRWVPLQVANAATGVRLPPRNCVGHVPSSTSLKPWTMSHVRVATDCGITVWFEAIEYQRGPAGALTTFHCTRPTKSGGTASVLRGMARDD